MEIKSGKKCLNVLIEFCRMKIQKGDGSVFIYCGLNHERCKLETDAVSQLVCLVVLCNEEIFLRQALKTNRYYSHSHKNCLFFLVKGRR